LSRDAATIARPLKLTLRMYAALTAAEFRRYATYRQAMYASTFTNSIFGFLRCFALLAAAAGAGGVAAGYSADRLATYVWAGQGLLGTVGIWGSTELADRIRSGEVVSDLQRPIDPVWQYLAADLGRAGFAGLTRFVVPMVLGALAFDLYAPADPLTYPLFVVSVLLAVVVCQACRYLVNAAAYWLLDSRGPLMAWMAVSATLSGMAFPLAFLPKAVLAALYLATPFPSLLQVPLDVLVERHATGVTLASVAGQVGWAVVMIAIARLVQRRAERKLVIQGG
jgi:ABC-2 type transport system permease protein